VSGSKPSAGQGKGI